MSERKSFLLRVDRELLDAVQRWAGDDLRSLNGQIEFVLRRALQQAGRLPAGKPFRSPADSTASDPVDASGRLDVDATGEP
jgi:hypothetical protein